jgi:CubicO group peptidase (beta-lactamase class C family)
MKTVRDGDGMGMEPFIFAGRTLYGHTGGSGSSGAWLAYDPEEKLALAYTTNAKIYAVGEIVTGVFEIYWNRPFQIPALNAFEVSPEVLDRYLGVYTIAGTPARMTVTRDGGDALHSSWDCARTRCRTRSHGRGQIQARSWSRLRIRRREGPVDDQTSQWGKGFYKEK